MVLNFERPERGRLAKCKAAGGRDMAGIVPDRTGERAPACHKSSLSGGEVGISRNYPRHARTPEINRRNQLPSPWCC